MNTQPIQYLKASPEERVAYGARELDRLKPGWHRLVDLDKLNIRMTDSCILGQTHSSFDDALELYGWDDGDAIIVRGFDIGYTKIHEYPELDAAWKTEIRKRLANDAVLANV